MIWYDRIWYDSIWINELIWNDMTWHDMIVHNTFKPWTTTGRNRLGLDMFERHLSSQGIGLELSSSQLVRETGIWDTTELNPVESSWILNYTEVKYGLNGLAIYILSSCPSYNCTARLKQRWSKEYAAHIRVFVGCFQEIMTVLHTCFYIYCIHLYSGCGNVLRMQICGKWETCIFRAAGWMRPVCVLACKWHVTSPLSTSNISAYWFSRRWAAVSRGFCFCCRLVANSADGQTSQTLVSLRFLCKDRVARRHLTQGWNCWVSWGCQLRSIWANRRCRGRRDLGNLQAEKDWKILEVLPELASGRLFLLIEWSSESVLPGCATSKLPGEVLPASVV